ncbi:type VII secretion-associated serine protease mycosin [Mycobacterium paragordonae]|uniref:type VII secretion-associated serine protease mycosin n=1 Tax=Mycobacterium paragordonae TaxID=1389713 RepID=UPI00105BC052|nr:type VII secretion-associated serine protease mycosin [Mycobacterium paragordonae]TDL03271.1 type VII secretion-associated serine protease mycosin [Mycobacterium paragordonae]
MSVEGCRKTVAAGLSVAALSVSALWVAAPTATAVEPPQIDVAALPADGPPGPDQPMRQGAYCTRVGTLPGTDYRVQPHFMDMLDLAEAWRFGRGSGVKVAVIDTGVSPHPRLPDLVGGGDYVVAGGDGLSDCDAHGTVVASLIAGAPADGKTPLPAPRQTRRPDSAPTTEAPPPPPPPQTVTVQVPPPPPPEEGPALWHRSASPVIAAAGAGLGPPITVPGAAEDPAPATSGEQPPPGPPSAPPPPAADGFSGVAPGVQIIAIRQSSRAFSPKDAFGGDQDPATRRKAGDIRTMARAIVHAANLGAAVINISEVSCMSATNIIDQRELGAAIRYAAVDRNAVIVAAAGNSGDSGNSDCKQNPVYDPLTPNDPRDWAGVTTVVTPAWFSDYVMTVGAVDATGAPLDTSMAGPWVSLAAPGTDIESVSPREDGLMNAVEGRDNTMVAPVGTSFSAAIVSGVAALVRAKYPQLTAHQVINRMLATARAPGRGVDNRVGHGIIDPVAALTYDIAPGEPVGPQRLSSPLVLAPPKVGRDMTAVWVAAGGVGALAVVCSAVLGSAALMRSRGQR